METSEKLLKELQKWNKEMTEFRKEISLVLKALNLVPVSEEELKKIQITQRDNMNKAMKVSEELDAMQNKDKELPSIDESYKSARDVYGDVLGDDILGGLN